MQIWIRVLFFMTALTNVAQAVDAGIKRAPYQSCFASQPSYGRVVDDKGIFLASPTKDGLYWYEPNGRLYRFPFQNRCWKNTEDGGKYCSFSVTTGRRVGKTFRIYRYEGKPDAIVERAADGHEMFYLVEGGQKVQTVEANQVLQNRLIREFSAIRLEIAAKNLKSGEAKKALAFVKGCKDALADESAIAHFADELLPELEYLSK